MLGMDSHGEYDRYDCEASYIKGFLKCREMAHKEFIEFIEGESPTCSYDIEKLGEKEV